MFKISYNTTAEIFTEDKNTHIKSENEPENIEIIGYIRTDYNQNINQCMDKQYYIE
jgi:hypothetical protein